MKASINPYFAEAKELIMEGLSFKLNAFENAIRDDLKINTEPRVNTDFDKLPGSPGFDHTDPAQILGVQ